MPQLRAVTFDLWQTLLLDEPGRADVRRHHRVQGTVDALAAVGLTVPYQRVEEAFRHCHGVFTDLQARGEDRSFGEQVGVFLQAVEEGLPDRLDPATLEGIAVAYRDALFVQPPLPDPQARQVLASLRDQGYRLGLISNTGATPGEGFRHYLQALGLLRFLDVLTFSDEVRLAKPAPRMFLSTLEQLGVDPAQAVHVGDHPRYDVAAAKGVGMRAVWVRNSQSQEPVTPPDAIVEHLGALPQALERMAGL